MNDGKKFHFGKRGQADIIGNILSTIPKPVIFIFFIVLLGIISALLSPLFNAFGIFCESDLTVVKVHDANIIDNFKLMSSMPDATEIAGDSIDPDRYIFDIIKCTEFYNGSERFITSGDCHTCTILEDVEAKNYKTDLCEGDAFRNDEADMSWWQRKVYCPTLDCRIPEGYYYEFDVGEYKCLTDCSSQTLANLRDKKLSELGAIPLYADDMDDMRFEGIFKFGCTKSLRVESTIKGVPIFRLEYWALILLIILMIWGLKHFGNK